MYSVLLILLLGISAALIIIGILKRGSGKVVIGAVVASSTIVFFWFLSFWGEMLWFESLGYSQRFWIVVFTKIVLIIVGALFGCITISILTSLIPRERKYLWIGSKVIGALIGGIWGPLNWDIILRYWNHVSVAISDPILKKDMGFYLFILPFYDSLYLLLLLLTIAALVAAFVSTRVVKLIRGEFVIHNLAAEPEVDEEVKKTLYLPLYICGAALLFVLAWGKYLNRFHLMYSAWGVVRGPGWTDVHSRLPAYNIVALLMVIFGIALLIPPVRNWIKRFWEKRNVKKEQSYAFVFATVGSLTIIMWILGFGIVPGLFQWLVVEPNEISLEKPYIENNISFTRRGFGLHTLEEREYPVSDIFTQETVQKNQDLFSNIRLWDKTALDAVYRQFQEIRLYYEFVDIDDDRYTVEDAYRQVMVSAREMEFSNLPKQSQTFVNRLFKYTHGYGITLTTVSEFTPDGLPNLLIKNIPPKSKYPGLEVKQPQIYYGELTQSHVVVNSREKEFDYPRGEENAYIHYEGSGGVRLSNLWRKFLFGWKFDGTRFFFSTYPTPESRIMFHRKVRERVEILAPFLRFDNDPYIVLVDGKLYWILDAYTTSDYFPYSEPFYSREFIEYRERRTTQGLYTDTDIYLAGINYIRNSIKAVVDTFDGSVNFYIFDPEDPIIQVWNKIFPDLFKKKEEMPEGLLAHIRYPRDIFLVQGLVYEKYHMIDPEVFYNQEDLWVRATEKYYGQVQPVEPYYIMWKQPESGNLEFILMLPFTPKNRQVLIGWIAGMCDPDNYGRFLAYKFPKEKWILGPQQLETKIDQDRFLSAQLTLWDQMGSRVIRGNVLTIPIDKTLFYVEPIYLQAETAAYPELRLVVIMHGDDFSYAETLDAALNGLFEKIRREVPPIEGVLPKEIPFETLIQEANDAFEDYLRFMGEKRFEEASQSLEKLKDALKQLLQ